MDTGRIVLLHRDWCVLETSHGYIVAENCDGHNFQVHDVLTGNLREHGDVSALLNDEQRVSLYVQAFDATQAMVLSLLQ